MQAAAISCGWMWMWIYLSYNFAKKLSVNFVCLLLSYSLTAVSGLVVIRDKKHQGN